MKPRRSAFAVAVLSKSLATAQAQSFPGESWPTARPANVGLNQAVLDSLDREIKAGQYGYVDRVLIIRHGKAVWDKRYSQDYVAAYDSLARIQSPLNAHDATGPYNYYAPWWHPYYRGGDSLAALGAGLHTLQSVTKTITSVIIGRSEEHTSELQSLRHLVCRLLLEKKKQKSKYKEIRATGDHKQTSVHNTSAGTNARRNETI